MFTHSNIDNIKDDHDTFIEEQDHAGMQYMHRTINNRYDTRP